MLVIHRRMGQGVRIGDTIFVKVIEIGRNRIKLGIEAPADLQIARDELPVFDHQQPDLGVTKEPA